ncbi:MAG: hypothetical protein GY737_31335 [Desulfobacteraceae bacterium]|nr:hypothetical protein [Desulfobacteraceae bacterium]
MNGKESRLRHLLANICFIDVSNFDAKMENPGKPDRLPGQTAWNAKELTREFKSMTLIFHGQGKKYGLYLFSWKASS